jgi:hypothetical protein
MTDDDILADWTRRDECLHGANTVIWFARCIERKAVAAERERCAAWCDNRAAYYRTDDDGPDGRGYVSVPLEERKGVESRRSLGAKACAEVIRWPANWGKIP